jgi:hypothetical protein
MRFYIFLFYLLLNSIQIFANTDSKSIKVFNCFLLRVYHPDNKARIVFSIIIIFKRDVVAPIVIDTKDCGTKKNCFISPNDCDIDNNKCIYVLKWDFDGHYINYELNAVVKGWITVLFSEDQKLVYFNCFNN